MVHIQRVKHRSIFCTCSNLRFGINAHNKKCCHSVTFLVEILVYLQLKQICMDPIVDLDFIDKRSPSKYAAAHVTGIRLQGKIS